MLERSIQSLILLSANGVPVVQENYNGMRPDGDHLSWSIVSMNHIGSTKKKIKPHGVTVTDTYSIDLSINSYGYKGYKELMRISASRYSDKASQTITSILSPYGSPVIKNTSFINDAENEPRYNMSLSAYYNNCVEFDIDLIHKWHLIACDKHMNGDVTVNVDKSKAITSAGKVTHISHIFTSVSRTVHQVNTHVLVNTASNPSTIIFDPSEDAQTGDVVVVTDETGNAATNNISVNFSGNLYGANNTFTLNCNYATMKFEYINKQLGWVKMS